ncbi:MAG: DNA cytosine methyltransferase [Planctomycetota bacterium]|nr:DNA cytosine methyltransferase [Planctomycetota bacterium]
MKEIELEGGPWDGRAFLLLGQIQQDGLVCQLDLSAEIGYHLEFRELVAADYGVPTSRRRLFVIMRCDGLPIVWPEPTHAPRDRCERLGLEPWVGAAEIIDWSLPCPSIFERKRPLVEATLRRVANGLRRLVFESAEPFLMPVTHSGAPRAHSLREPLRTVTSAHRGEHALVLPFVSSYYGAKRQGEGRGVHLAGPLRVQGTENRFALVAAFLAKHYGGQTGTTLRRTAPTQTQRGTQNQLVAGYLTKLYGTSTGADLRKPLPTVTGGGQHLAEVRAFLVKYYGSASHGQDLREPLHTVTDKARFGLVEVHGELYRIADIGMRMLTPRELARAHGFPESYRLTGTKTNQVARIGNSVPPRMAEVLVRANLADMALPLEASAG